MLAVSIDFAGICGCHQGSLENCTVTFLAVSTDFAGIWGCRRGSLEKCTVTFLAVLTFECSPTPLSTATKKNQSTTVVIVVIDARLPAVDARPRGEEKR